MPEDLITTVELFSITIPSDKVFMRNCCLMMDVWRMINDDDPDGHETDLRRHPAYKHHFAFFYRLPRPDNLDDEMVDSAMESAHVVAIAEHHLWDGGKAIWDCWCDCREYTISKASDADINEWKEKYILINPELFIGCKEDTETVRQALRSNSDSYMKQVLTHLVSI